MQSLVILGLLGSSALAHPSVSSANKKPWKPSLSKRVVDLDQFRPGTAATYINATETNSSPDTKLIKRDDYVATATALVKSKVPDAEFRVYDSYVGTNGIGHVYFRQTIFGIDVDNTDFNVNVSAKFRQKGLELAADILFRSPRMAQSFHMVAASTLELCQRPAP